MSINIWDVMKLPSLQGAKVVAGHRGMNRTITSISVLELDDPEILGFDVYGHTRCFGSEILITAFMSCRNDVDVQCETIRRLKGEGEIGIIIFYVGCVLPEVDAKLIHLADEIDMPLIIMPEGRIELRYSDVICEVMEAVIKDREENVYFAAELIERISHIQESERSINTVLSLIRDRTHCSIFLLDEADEMLNYVEWPNERDLPLKEIISRLDNINRCDEILEINIDGRPFYVERSIIVCEDTNLSIVIVKEKNDINIDSCNQINYVVKTYLNLWTKNYGKLNTKQLISAVINDEPEKMHLIADKLGVNIANFCYTYFLFSKNSRDHEYSHLKTARGIVKDFVAVYDNSFLVDIFDETVAILATREKETPDNDLADLLSELKSHGLDYYAAVFDTISTTEEAKESYWLLQQCKKYIPIIFPLKNIFTGGELGFIQKCKKQFEQKPTVSYIQKKIHQQPLLEKNKVILTNTLETFLLDGDRNLLKTSELMFIHINTMKYRIKNLEGIFGHKLTRMPEVYDLYFDAALDRLNKAISNK